MHKKLAFLLPLSLAAGLAGVVVSCKRSDPIAEMDSTIDLSASPQNIVLGNGSTGKSTITALLSDSNGAPEEGIGIQFTTDAGTLASNGVRVKTNSHGIAQDVLTTGDDATVTAKSGDAIATVDVTVNSAGAPMASLTVTPNPQKIGMNVTFDGTKSTPGSTATAVTRWIWTLASDIPDADPSARSECVGANPRTCTFDGVGLFTDSFSKRQTIVVQLRVQDDQGKMSGVATAASSLKITGNPLPPIADAGSNQVVNANQSVFFSALASRDQDSAGSVVRYDWDFGDLSTSNNNPTATVSHTYTSASGPGGYTVTLTVWDDGDGTGSCVVVNTPPCPGSLSDTATVNVVVN